MPPGRHTTSLSAPVDDEYTRLVCQLDKVEQVVATQHEISERLRTLEEGSPGLIAAAHFIWSSTPHSMQLEEACSLAIWDALQSRGAAGIPTAQRIVRERYRRSDPLGVADVEEISEEEWRAACLIAGLMPDLPAFRAVTDEQRMVGNGKLKHLLATLMRNAPEGIKSAPHAVHHLRRAAATIWDPSDDLRMRWGTPMGSRDDLHSVTDLSQIATRVRMAVRVASANDDPDAGPAPLSLRLSCPPSAFAAVVEQLQDLEGFAGVVAARSRDVGTKAPVQVYLSARCHWLLDERPLQLEIAVDLGRTRTTSAPSQRRKIAELAGEAKLVAPDGEVVEVYPRGAVIAGLLPGQEIPDGSGWAAVGADRLFGEERCTHRRSNWESSPLNLTRRLTCKDCLRGGAAVVPTHRLPDAEFQAQIRQDDFSAETYMACERIRSSLVGEDPDGVPDTIDELRRRDGVMSLHPADYAIGPVATAPTRRETIDQALTGRRRG